MFTLNCEATSSSNVVGAFSTGLQVFQLCTHIWFQTFYPITRLLNGPKTGMTEGYRYDNLRMFATFIKIMEQRYNWQTMAVHGHAIYDNLELNK